MLCVIYEKSTGFLYVSTDIHSLFPPQHVVNDVDDDTLPVRGGGDDDDEGRDVGFELNHSFNLRKSPTILTLQTVRKVA